MRNVLLFGLAVLALTCTATAYGGWVATDNFESPLAGNNVSGQNGWTASGAVTDYKTVAGGAGGGQGITIGTGSTQLNWTGHPWNWGTDLNVGDKVIARMDFQANGSGAFDDDRVGWVMASNPNSSSYHFAVQLDNPEGGLRTYFRTLTGGEGKSTLIDNATLGATGSNWYREEMQVTKLLAVNGLNGARVDVSFWALDGSGNPVGSPKTASTTIDTSAWRGFSSDVYPMYKNYSATAGNADNAYFAIIPEPSTLAPNGCGGFWH